jgi:Tol biopolymer transport system component
MKQVFMPKSRVLLLKFTMIILVHLLLKGCTINTGAPDPKNPQYKVLFAGGVGKLRMLWIANLDGSNRWKLADFKQEEDITEVSASFSPDGTKIAYVTPSEDVIYVINSDGTNRQKIINPIGKQPLFPRWSPDGKRLVFRVQGGDANGSTMNLFVANADGSNVKQIYSQSFLFNNAYWSPSGEKIAFQKVRLPSLSSIMTINADGSNITTLTDTTSAFDDIEPRWLPASNRLIYLTRSREIYSVKDDGSDRRPFAIGLKNITWFDSPWSPNGQYIIATERSASNYLVTISGTYSRMSNSESLFPTIWLPDSERIISNGEGLTPSIINRDGTNQRQFLEPPAIVLAVSPVPLP